MVLAAMLRRWVWSPCLLLLGAAGDSCFVHLKKPLEAPPFSAAEEAELWRLFEANVNVNGLGAVIASPGACPAQVDCCGIMDPMPYGFHWTRDASLSLLTLLERVERSTRHNDEPVSMAPSLRGWRTSDSTLPELRSDVEKTIVAYAAWVARMHGRTRLAGNLESVQSAAEEAFVEPKWSFDGEPYRGGWCRPQTDGPALRARLLMRAAEIFPHLVNETLWPLAQKDLDWLVEHHSMESCDLWEETRDSDFLWNRVVQLAALVEGHHFATDPVLKRRYLDAAQQKGKALANHVANHSAGEEFLTNCPAMNAGKDCVKYNKTLDGVLILTLIHGRPMVPTEHLQLPKFLDPVVANTVRQLSLVFCESYPINQEDTAAEVPGVLMGRYAKDRYGHQKEGNPWVLITASLANLLYKACSG
ncbi:4-alpha-D-glucan glucohydrolase) (Glucan 1, partial [Durusdinium trenchii]